MSDDSPAFVHRPMRPIPLGWIVLALVLAVPATGAILILVALGPVRQEQTLLGLPFTTRILEVQSGHSETPKGRVDYVDRIAERRSREIARYVFVDIGDVRIALARSPKLTDLLHTGEGTGTVVIDSNQPADLDGMGSGGGGGKSRLKFYAYRDKGVTSCTLNHVKFTIEKAEIYLPGATIPVGKGRKVVFLDGNGCLDRVVDLEAAATR